MTYYFYGCMYKDKLTEYSPIFIKIEDSLNWYNKHGVKLETIFNRILEPTIKIVI